ncbi:hypothetical protein [Leptodesmis sichuanensis]|uniref:hypothetical protein n=1 Tax=Leptodesmis sichuanensis TaxID=2906798 RepID=UPI001F444C06|nr:hypothetical protein [Leptodesmis sichuanensis]UIE37693.1 hypothetical protein KIK02_22670 [Leptodesmis sichuanensis A121]
MPKLAKLGVQGDLRPVSLIVNLQSPEIEMPKLVLGSAFLVSSVRFGFALPGAAQIPSAACNTVIRQGATLNWMTLGNGLPIN